MMEERLDAIVKRLLERGPLAFINLGGARGLAENVRRLSSGKEDKRQAGLEKALTVAVKAHNEAFNESYSDLFGTVKDLHDKGESLQAIADKLNEIGHTTRRGKPWNRMQVSRVLKRVG